jgi:hypothetical protein
MILDQLANNLAYQQARRKVDEYEQRDLCALTQDFVTGPFSGGTNAEEFFSGLELGASPEFDAARTMAEGSMIVGGGRVLKKVRGMGTVYDWRGSSWTPASGGKIKPLVFVQHIPVVPNMAGIADFVRLRDVLVAQGLMVQNATDRDGNVALYTPMNMLCWQARGANQFSCGTEHMHMSIGEDWTKHQLRASAWLVNQALDKYNIPTYRGNLAAGDGVARVKVRGQVSHEQVSRAAGYNDRTDPGNKYDWEYVRKCVFFYREHAHFVGV